jgi:hypothetical protein
LVGFEVNDIINAREGQIINAKALPLNNSIRSWSALIENDNVVFARGLGTIFRATLDIPRCISTPPEGQDILVCPVYLLQEKLEERCCIFGEDSVTKPGPNGYTWLFTRDPYKFCQNETARGHCSCWNDRLQRVNSKGSMRYIEKSISRLTLTGQEKSRRTHLPFDMHGAICFGGLRKVGYTLSAMFLTFTDKP